jgi:lactoylglutathione lyase
MLGLWQSGFGPLSLKLHVAFRVDLPMLLAAPRLLSQVGITVRNFGGEETQEPCVLLRLALVSLQLTD